MGSEQAWGARGVRVGCAWGARGVRVGWAWGARGMGVGCVWDGRGVRVGCAWDGRGVRVGWARLLMRRGPEDCPLHLACFFAERQALRRGPCDAQACGRAAEF